MHVKGLTARHPAIPEARRGTYAGLGHPVAIDHLTNLGVTSVELLPVQQFVQDAHVVDRGLRNYWGFNSIGFFAPHNEYAAFGQGREQVQEFKRMVRALHEAGLEVILDVVYNHTAEGNHLGPSLVTAHDGLTLADLVPYNRKHNEANGEDNADGEDHNRSWNCGAEGPSHRSRCHCLAYAPAAELHRHAAAVSGCAHAAGR